MTKILAVLTPTKATQILRELANLRGEWPLTQNLDAYKRTESAIKRMCLRHPGAFKDCTWISLFLLRDLIRKAWGAPDERSAQWSLFRLRHLYWETVRRVRAVQKAAKSPSKLEPELPTIPGTVKEAMRTVAGCEPPPRTQMEAAVFFLQQNLRSTRYCANADCPAPYFLAKRANQKYCSEECFLPALWASKRKWWSQNRSKRRK